MITIGLTGNISSGKSTVSRYLAGIGARIIDADQISRDIVLPGSPALTEIINYFGHDVLDHSGELDRKHLGELVFANQEALEVLNGITHPRILEAIMNEKKDFAVQVNNGNAIIVIDAPLLIETGLHEYVDEIWVVTIEPGIQMQRLMLRDKISEEEARKRIASQMPQDEKVKFAHVIIDNSGSPEDTINQVRQRVAELNEELH